MFSYTRNLKKEYYESLNESAIEDLLTSTLKNYITNLDEDDKSLMCLSITTLYTETKLSKKLKGLDLIVRHYHGRIRQTKCDAFSLWKSNLSHSTSFHGGLSTCSNKHRIHETSWTRKEREELEHCTFHPNINKDYEFHLDKKQSGSSVPVHQRLYGDHEKNIARKELRQIENDKREACKLSFTPQKISTKTSLDEKNFIERQNDFLKSKTNHKNKILNELEEENEQIYTFTPQVLGKKYPSTQKDNLNTLSYFSSQKVAPYAINKQAHLRLYEDHHRRKMKSKEKEQREIRRVKEKTNGERSGSVDPKRIQELYNQHKKNQEKKQILQKSIDAEQGITFKPLLYTVNSGEKYVKRINPDFIERNKKLLEDKENFVEYSRLKFEENLQNEKFHKGRYTKDEVEQINKNIIERLYGGKKKDLVENEKDSLMIDDCSVDASHKEESKHEGKRSVNTMNTMNSNLNFAKDRNMKQVNEIIVPNYNDKIISVENYTFGKNKRDTNKADNHYRYNFEEESSEYKKENYKTLIVESLTADQIAEIERKEDEQTKQVENVCLPYRSSGNNFTSTENNQGDNR